MFLGCASVADGSIREASFEGRLRYIMEIDVVIEASKGFLKEMAALTSKRTVDWWAVPPGLLPIQTCPVHKMHFHENVYMDAKFIIIVDKAPNCTI